MVAIISGKIVDAWKANPNTWLYKLKQLFLSFGESPTHWEIFGGNAFLLKIKYPEEAVFIGMIIKAIFRQVSDLDVAIDIGIGAEDEAGKTLRTSTGSAFQLSQWDNQENNFKKAHFRVHLQNEELVETLNLLLEIASVNMDSWSVAEAEVVELCLLFPEKNQQEIAEWLRIKQSAVSQRRGRAHLDLLLKVDSFYRKKYTEFSDSLNESLH